MLNRSIFATRLKALREKNGLNYTSLAEKLGVSSASLGYYERGERVPDIETTQKLCKLFYVTSDYLLGLSDTPSPDIEDQAICRKLGCSGETLDALKIILNSEAFNFNYPEEGPKYISKNSLFTQLFIIASSNESLIFPYRSIFNQIRECVESRRSLEEIKHRYDETQSRICEIENNSVQLGSDHEYLYVKYASGEIETELENLRNDSSHLFKKISEQQTNVDSIEWGLQKSIMKILDVITEGYGTTWQA